MRIPARARGSAHFRGFAVTHERRIFLPLPPVLERPWIELPHQTVHHLVHVLRLPPGSAITLVDPHTGTEYEAALEKDDGSHFARILSTLSSTTRSTPVKTLIFALCKGKVNDLVCEKATELGAQRIVFWMATRSIVRIDRGDDRQRKLERWQKIAESAACQCARNDLPTVILALNLEEALAPLVEDPLSDRRFCCSLSPGARTLKNLDPVRSPSHLVIGPEGDLTPDEEETLQNARFELLSLGTLRLRAETAAVAALSMLAAAYEISS
jgi:16S rRNA (uracil1498-N3)-methyltransferase